MSTPLHIPEAPAHLRALAPSAPSPFDNVPGAFDVTPLDVAPRADPSPPTIAASTNGATPHAASTNAAATRVEATNGATTTPIEETTNAATTNEQPQQQATWQQSDVDEGRCRTYELGQPKPEGAVFSDVRYWTAADAREGRCDIFDINQPKPAPSAAPSPAASVGGGVPVTPALLASLVADGSAAALKYLRDILDDVNVPAVLRIKAAQSLLTTLPKQINVTNELVVSARSYDALMAQAAELLALRAGGAGAGAPRVTDERTQGNVIDVMSENEAAA